ncbi:MAG: ATP-binding protein [Candidatus Nanopelagicales bacterium]
MSSEQIVDPPIQVAKTHRLALLGAESSGKTTLAMELTKALRDLGYNAGMVPEYLRIWCIENGRTPDFTEQEAIIEGQLALEDAAATQFAVLVCDPAAITTGFYSLEYFGSDLHLEWDLLERYDQLFLCDIDFPWRTDPLRDGEIVRTHMHALIVDYLTESAEMLAGNIPLLSGSTSERLAVALALLNLD